MVQWSELKDWVKTVENEAERFLKTHKKYVFIYGAGIAGHWYLQYLKSKNISVEGFIVSDLKKYSTIKAPGGLEVYSLDDVISEYTDYSIIIGSPKYKLDIQKIVLSKCSKEDVYSFEGEIYFSFIHNIEKYRIFLLNNWNRIDALYKRLADQKSRDTLQNFIMGRVSGNQDYFTNSMVPDQYYPKDIICFSNCEVFVECGANNGNTMLDFVHCVNNFYKHIYLFEPDKGCIKRIRSVVSKNKLKGVSLIEKGAWDCQTTLTFAGDDSYGSGHITETGEETIETATIDDTIEIPPTYIKMDIEGAEMNALRGVR